MDVLSFFSAWSAWVSRRPMPWGKLPEGLLLNSTCFFSNFYNCALNERDILDLFYYRKLAHYFC